MPEIKEKILNTGTEVVTGAPQEVAALIKSDMAKVIKDACIKGDRFREKTFLTALIKG